MNRFVLLFAFLFFFGTGYSYSQTSLDSLLTKPKIWLSFEKDSFSGVKLSDKSFPDKVIPNIDTNDLSNTNFNPSLSIRDNNPINITYDSLQLDSIVTIITAYQTEDDNIVGLWEITCDTNTLLWLNSQNASYKDLSIRYRKTNEKGVIVNTTQFTFPTSDSLSTNLNNILTIGKAKDDFGEKNFCEYIYIKGILTTKEQQRWESYLAIKYGALLHNIYVNSDNDTLWDTNLDSLYSFGIAAIGRDDAFPLYQRKSKINNDKLSLEFINDISNKEYLFLGKDDKEDYISDNVFYIDTMLYHTIDTKYKLKPIFKNNNHLVKLTYKYPIFLNPDNIRLLIDTINLDFPNFSNVLYLPSSINDSTITFDISVTNNTPYYFQIAFCGDIIINNEKEKIISDKDDNFNSKDNNSDDIQITLTPNPSNGAFHLQVKQKDATMIDVFITDSHGRTISTHRSNSPTNDYHLRDKIDNEGVYFINIQTPKEKKTHKLIISK